MSDTIDSGIFFDRETYLNEDVYATYRCADCGSPPKIDWTNISTFGARRKTWRASDLWCPNGPHKIIANDDTLIQPTSDLPLVTPVSNAPVPSVTQCLKWIWG